MQLRPIQSAEYPVVSQLANEIWPVCYSEILSKPQLDYMLQLMYTQDALEKQAKNGQQFFLLEEGPEIFGFLGVQFHYPEKTDIRVHKLYVRTTIQGKGLGRFMLDQVAEMGAKNGCTRIHLNVNRFNIARDFYAKMGFEIIREEDIDIGSGYLMEDYVMVKKL